MERSHSTIGAKRLKDLEGILTHERNQALAKVREFRKLQEEDTVPPPADDLDAARSLADVETHAGLIERVEDRLKAIDAAFSRIERGRYGLCEGCGEPIPIGRLKVLPFARFCVDCQRTRNRSHVGEGSVDEPSSYVWAPPENMEEDETPELLADAEEQLSVRYGQPMGEEVGELERLPGSLHARRRPRARRAR